MSLSQLNIHHLRNVSSARLHLHPKLNVFYGANGSGKSTLLEAIYLLGTGHSFRTREISPLLQTGQQLLTVFARTHREETISVQKSIASPTQVQINQTPCRSSSDLAHFLPCQVFYQDIFQIMDAGPAVRRSLLDWGLFHVKQTYLSVWKDYRRVLKQRNALLRAGAARRQFIPWDEQLVQLAEMLNVLRTEYFAEWIEAYHHYHNVLTDVPCDILYYKGWDRRESGKSLMEILNDQFQSDLLRQHTQSGPHQADLSFATPNLKAKQELSRGQQKIILIALKLSQASLVAAPCIYLFDDIVAELDEGHVQRLLRCIATLKGQSFLTVINPDQLYPNIECHEEFSIYSIQKGEFKLVSRETTLQV
jgi:DNA replication and repair protein RecF